MLLGWDLSAWLVVVIVPLAITLFSILFYLKGDKDVQHNLTEKRDEQ
ncbi:hypothetical protein [Planococcus plakortidis]|nr:hypothetical protein [Planococcus plakortidis]